VRWGGASMSSSTERQTFRETVALVAAKAKEKLPQAVNGRLEGAVKLVLAQDVTPQADGSIAVGSCTDPLKVYHLVGATCDCKDFTDGKAPEGWCRHRIAAGIAKRVGELLPPPAPEVPSPASAPLGEAPAGLPEAACSVNCHITIGGRPVQVTLRGISEDEVLSRMEKVLQKYPVLPSGTARRAITTSGETSDTGQPGWCPLHNTAMRWNAGKDGRKGWQSHRTEDGWCKGR
jgi:hypothetical protein